MGGGGTSTFSRFYSGHAGGSAGDDEDEAGAGDEGGKSVGRYNPLFHNAVRRCYAVDIYIYIMWVC